MNTLFLVLAEFGSAEIPLNALAEKYLGLSPAQAKRQAGRQALPFPVHRGSKSQKAPWLVHAQDLADHIDQQRAQARSEWRALNNAA